MSDKTVSKCVTVTIEPTALDLARIFWANDADYQAEFFTRLFAEVCCFNSMAGFSMQMAAVTQSQKLSPGGKLVMDSIGAYD